MYQNIIAAIYLYISISIANCSTSQTNDSGIKAVEVYHLSSMGEGFYRVYQSGDLVMYQNHYFYKSSAHQLQFDSSINQYSSPEIFSSSERREQFFVHHKDSLFGYRYDPSNNMNDNLRVKVDSVVKIITGTNRFDSFLTLKPDSVIWGKAKTDLREVFLFPAEKGLPAVNMQFYYSKNLNHLPHSLNEKVDSAKMKKLYKVEVRFDSFYSQQQNIHWPAMKDVIEIRDVIIEDEDKIRNFFNRYLKK